MDLASIGPTMMEILHLRVHEIHYNEPRDAF